eukprot:c15984_g1_i3.p1 GENE.c15984_g1_i3~~c15984_g1_i3.p1  ORF type:complete len:139 (+),score=6.71 c15984_g1_i3:1-417(+)
MGRKRKRKEEKRLKKEEKRRRKEEKRRLKQEQTGLPSDAHPPGNSGDREDGLEPSSPKRRRVDGNFGSHYGDSEYRRRDSPDDLGPNRESNGRGYRYPPHGRQRSPNVGAGGQADQGSVNPEYAELQRGRQIRSYADL